MKAAARESGIGRIWFLALFLAAVLATQVRAQAPASDQGGLSGKLEWVYVDGSEGPQTREVQLIMDHQNRVELREGMVLNIRPVTQPRNVVKYFFLLETAESGKKRVAASPTLLARTGEPVHASFKPVRVTFQPRSR